MTLETIYYAGQTIAVLIIILTLFAVLYQQRQANKIARNELSIALTSNSYTMFNPVTTDPEISEFFVRVNTKGHKLTDAERLRYANFMHGMIVFLRGSITLAEAKLSEPYMMEEAKTAVKFYMNYPRSRIWWWRASRSFYGEGIQSIVDEMIPELAPDEAPSEETSAQSAVS